MLTFEATPNNDALRILDAALLAEAAADDAEQRARGAKHHRGNACGFERDHGTEALGTIARAAAGAVSEANQAKAACETAQAAYREAFRLAGKLPSAMARAEMEGYLASGRRATDRAAYARDEARHQADEALGARERTEEAWVQRADALRTGA